MGLIIFDSANEAGPEISINCPACKSRNVKASVYDQRDRALLLGLIPVATTNATWVKCTSCRGTHLSQKPWRELRGLSAAQLDGVIVTRISPILKLFAIASVLLFLLAPVGLICGVIGAIGTRRSPGWVRKLSQVGIILSSLSLIVWIIAIASGK
jgi:hypothetical protein